MQDLASNQQLATEIVGTTADPRYAREGGKMKRKKMEPRNVN